jgi:hypothetical protein
LKCVEWTDYMEHTPEQHDIIRRIGEATARFDEAAEAQVAAEAEVGRDLIDIATKMIAAINRTGELVRLNRICGDLFREYLDTLR